MTLSRRHLIGSAAGLAAMPGLARAQSAAAPFKIGVLTDMGGINMASGGPGSVMAATMEVEDFGGRVLNRPVVVISGDHQNKPDVGASLARRCYDQDGVELILDVPTSPVALAGQKVARQKGKAVIFSSAGTSLLTVTVENAMDYIAGYAIGLDITIRGPEERSMRKSLNTYTVLGPWFVTADEIPDPASLDLALDVNGEPRQRANTRDLILDILLTGTPEGVGPIMPGDVMDARIEHVGAMRVAVQAGAA